MASKTAAEVQASTPANEQGPSGNPVDFEHLARYTLDEPELEREVLGLFCSQSVLLLDQLRAAKSDEDWKQAAHSLKGSARAIGAWRMAQAAEQAEALQGDGLSELRSARVDEVEASLREAEAYIATVLESR